MPVRLSEIDFRIIREIMMGSDTYLSPDRVSAAEIARRIGAHPNTVHAHLRKLTEARYMIPPVAFVDPGPVGLYAARAFLPVAREHRTKATQQALFEIEGAHSVFHYLDGWDFGFFAEDAEGIESRARLGQAITRSSSFEWETPMRPEGKGSRNASLSALDVRLVVALLEDILQPLPTIAQRLGVTPRTVERRCARLREQALLRAYPRIESDATGATLGYLRVTFEGQLTDSAWAALMKAAPKQVGRSRMKNRAWLWIYSGGSGEMEEVAARAAAVPGVNDLRLRVLVRVHHNPGFGPWIQRVLSRRVLHH